MILAAKLLFIIMQMCYPVKCGHYGKANENILPALSVQDDATHPAINTS